MEIVTADKILEIHQDIISRFGGTNGVLNLGTLDYLVYRASRETDPYRRAAPVLYHIGVRHPFIDGNKRTAFMVADTILGEAGHHIVAE